MTPDIVIRPLDKMDDMAKVEALQLAVWPGSEMDVVPGHLLITIAHNGGVLLGAFSGSQIVGYVLGFLGVDDGTPERVAMSRLKHCSHMLGVLPEWRGKGVGYALKLAQRQMVIDQGIHLMTWTYDPLQSRNAHLNIRRLGGVARTYIRDAYGTMRDGLNKGTSSDRFLLEWWVNSPRVASRISATRGPLDLANFLAAGAQKINPAVLGHDDLVRPSEGHESISGNLVLVEIPSDFDDMKHKDGKLAMAWREHTREIFQKAFEAGYLATDFVHFQQERYPRSYYLLINGEGTLG